MQAGSSKPKNFGRLVLRADRELRLAGGLRFERRRSFQARDFRVIVLLAQMGENQHAGFAVEFAAQEFSQRIVR